MDSNAVISHTTQEGHQYLIQFSSVTDNLVLPDGITIGISDVAIVLVSGDRVNNASTFYTMSEIIKNYLISNDVVLYCYCDHKEILRSKKHQPISPQEYRNMLFNKMFDRHGNQDFINRSFFINDPQHGDHYINLISRSSNIDQINLIERSLMQMEKT